MLIAMFAAALLIWKTPICSPLCSSPTSLCHIAEMMRACSVDMLYTAVSRKNVEYTCMRSFRSRLDTSRSQKPSPAASRIARRRIGLFLRTSSLPLSSGKAVKGKFGSMDAVKCSKIMFAVSPSMARPMAASIWTINCSWEVEERLPGFSTSSELAAAVVWLVLSAVDPYLNAEASELLRCKIPFKLTSLVSISDIERLPSHLCFLFGSSTGRHERPCFLHRTHGCSIPGCTHRTFELRHPWHALVGFAWFFGRTFCRNRIGASGPRKHCLCVMEQR